MAKKFYAIKKGRVCPAVVKTWKECQDLTNGFPGPKFKGFDTEPEAWKWLNEENDENQFSSKKDEFDIVYIFSDGACSGNPGPGGWGAVIKFNGQSSELSDYKDETTNNEMELNGFLAALKFAIQNYGKQKKIIATLDSQYVLNGAKQWMFSWAENGWKRPSGGPIQNLELWQEIYKITKDINIEYIWIKGHAGHPENERCDKLAVYAYKSIADKTFLENEKSSKNEPFTNLSLFRSVDKETLVKIMCGNKFKNILFTEGPARLMEILDMPAQDWGIDSLKKVVSTNKK